MVSVPFLSFRCKQDCTQQTKTISMKLGDRVQHGPRMHPLNFGCGSRSHDSSTILVSFSVTLRDMAAELGIRLQIAGKFKDKTEALVTKHSQSRIRMTPLEMYIQTYKVIAVTDLHIIEGSNVILGVDLRPPSALLVSGCPYTSTTVMIHNLGSLLSLIPLHISSPHGHVTSRT